MTHLQPKNEKTLPRPEPELLPAVIESLLFVADEPQEIGTLAKSLNTTRDRIEKAVEHLIDSTDGRGVFVQRMGDRVQLATVPAAAPYIERFLEVEFGRLSRASLETLAIIAYRSPVTRAQIEAVRGVNSDHSVATLQSRGLIEELGRAPGPGRPVLFATTVRFLEYFGLQRPEDLPPLPQIDELAEIADAAASIAEAPETNDTAEGPPELVAVDAEEREDG
ncbi:MAG: SMC-Scp complex subunit ScpB [Dehalococcoidia bacterium]